MTGGVDLVAHHNNFLDAVAGAVKPNAPALDGHLAAGVCHLTNISGRLRRTVELDPAAEAVTGRPEANAMLRRAYRPGHWSVPKVV